MTSIFYSSNVSDSQINERKNPRETYGISLESFYELDSTISFLKNQNYRRIALQFPDEYLSDASQIFSILKNSLDSQYEFFILGDTSYGSCCVDEVASEHYAADIVIHYGPSCLSRTNKLPCWLVFGRVPLDLTQFCSEFIKRFQKEDKILIFYDLIFSHSMNDLKKKLVDSMHFNYTKISSIDNSIIPIGKGETFEEKNHILGRNFDFEGTTSLLDYQMIYIGQEGVTLTNFLLTFNRSKWYTFNPTLGILRQETLNVNKTLMRRYYLVEKTKDADIIGIVVGTLSVGKYLDMIEKLKVLIKNAGKKFYVFVVGKLNVAKLANFQEIDIFVIVACPENSLLENRDFYRSVITPFELEIALTKGKQWTGEYIIDFSNLLPGLNTNEEKNSNNEEREEVHVSLITGNIKIRKFSSEKNNNNTSTDIIERNNNTSIEIWSPASKFFQSRSWTGLEQKIGETEVAKAIEGRSGLAKSYDGEK